MKSKTICTAIILLYASISAYAVDMKQAPAVIQAAKNIEQMGCKPWLGVMRSAKLLLKSSTDDNAFVVPMRCGGQPQAILAAQKSGKTFVSKETFKIVSTIKFDGKTISGMATPKGGDKPVAYKIEAFK